MSSLGLKQNSSARNIILVTHSLNTSQNNKNILRKIYHFNTNTMIDVNSKFLTRVGKNVKYFRETAIFKYVSSFYVIHFSKNHNSIISLISIDTNMANDSLANCTCETRSVLVNATIHGDPDNVTSEIWCPVYNDCCNIYLNGLAYWLEGVIQVTFGIIGILMNIGSSLILGSKEMRNPFNLLLIALCLFDCGYLFGAILESFRKSFKLVSNIMQYKNNWRC